MQSQKQNQIKLSSRINALCLVRSPKNPKDACPAIHSAFLLIKEEVMKKTGIFATTEEKEILAKEVKQAMATPVIAFSSEHALEKGGLAGEAWQAVREHCHKIAIGHGLPETEGFYGLDVEGEFVTTD